VTQAFGNHSIALGSSAMVAARAPLAGSVSAAARGASVSVSKAATDDVRRRLGASSGEKLSTRAVVIAGTAMAEVTRHREVDLTGIASFLKGVRAQGSEPVLVGNIGPKNAAVMSSLPDPAATEDEVRAFVSSLVARNEISHAGSAKAAKGIVNPEGGKGERKDSGLAATHRVATRGGQKVLERVAFVCGCRACRERS
jgi:hypothetical protein